MGLLKNISSNISNTIKDYYTSKNNLDYSVDNYNSWVSAFPQYSEKLKEDYRSFAYAAMNCRAEKVRETKDYVYQNLASGKIKEIINHPFIDLLNKQNIYGQTFKQIKYLVALSLDLFGNAFIYYPKNRLKMPEQLIVIPANRIKINYNSDYTQIASYGYLSNPIQKVYSIDELIHIKLPDPYSQFWGRSTISAIRFAVDTDWYQSAYNENFYKNDASVGGVLEAPSRVNDSEFSRLQSQLHGGHSGYQNAGKWLIVQEGMKASRMNATPKEAQFMDSRLALRDEVFGVFKVNKSILGYTDDVNRANAESARYSFLQNTIKPFAENISDAFDSFIKVNYDERLMFKFDYDLQQDATEQRLDLEFLTKYGALKLNEVREAKGYSPQPELDVYYTQPSTQNNNNKNTNNNDGTQN